MARWLERGWITGSPHPSRFFPPFGGYQERRKCTISVSEREALAIGCKPAAGRCVLFLLDKVAR
jgi:hypothetical protein